MQSTLGRIFFRVFSSNVQTELKTKPQDLKFVTGCSGFSKSLAPIYDTVGPSKKWTYGDDAYFVARDKTADVLGEMSSTYRRLNVDCYCFRYRF